MKTKYLIITSGVIIAAIIGVIISVSINNTDISESTTDSSNPEILKETGNQNKSLIGTWTKEKTYKEGGNYPGDKEWQLEVTFDENGQFIWDSKRKGQDGKTIDESLAGTYTIEKGFLVSYKFDKPTSQASEKIPELFAFWPNQMLGQQTYKFNDEYLILGHDGEKIWISLKKKD
jgi:hypothetical protein